MVAHYSAKPFGDIPIVIMYGDWQQLPAVSDRALFEIIGPRTGGISDATEGSVSKTGGSHYQKFDAALVLRKASQTKRPAIQNVS